MMKKQLLVGIVLLGGLLFAAKLAYRNFHDVGPAFEPAPGDISDIIDRANEPGNTTDMPLSLPPGFSITVFARDLEGPRVMLWAPDGRLYVTLTSAGKVVALRDADGNGKAEEQTVALSGLNRPHGITTRCTEQGCTLYVAEATGVFAYGYNETNEILRSSRRKILDLPNTLADQHFTRSLLFRPYPNDAELLVSVGSSCNVCRESDERYASIMALNVETGQSRIFARGLRNAVFMATHPVNGATWATEMGRDRLGDDVPPDEINIIESPSPPGSGQNSAPQNFGWPTCYGKNVHDADFDKNTYIRNPCMEPFETPSYIDVPAHSPPLGLAFVPQNSNWPVQYKNNLLVAYHGSWNRSVHTGYKVVRIQLNAQENFFGYRTMQNSIYFRIGYINIL